MGGRVELVIRLGSEDGREWYSNRGGVEYGSVEGKERKGCEGRVGRGRD